MEPNYNSEEYARQWYGSTIKTDNTDYHITKRGRLHMTPDRFDNVESLEVIAICAIDSRLCAEAKSALRNGTFWESFEKHKPRGGYRLVMSLKSEGIIKSIVTSKIESIDSTRITQLIEVPAQNPRTDGDVPAEY